MRKLIILLTCLLLTLSTQKSWSQTQEIKFGTGYFYPPFVYTDNGGRGVHGFDIELVLALCKEIGATCTFSQAVLQENLKKLDAGDIDATVGAFSITNLRKVKYDFAGPYFSGNMSYLELATGSIKTPQDIIGKAVGVIRGSTFQLYLEQTFGKRIKLKTYTTTDDLIQALAENKVNVVLIDAPVAQFWVKNSSGKFKIVPGTEQLDIPFDEGYGIAFRRGTPQLVAQFNNALLVLMKNGTYDAIRKKYF